MINDFGFKKKRRGVIIYVSKIKSYVGMPVKLALWPLLRGYLAPLEYHYEAILISLAALIEPSSLYASFLPPYLQPQKSPSCLQKLWLREESKFTQLPND